MIAHSGRLHYLITEYSVIHGGRILHEVLAALDQIVAMKKVTDFSH